MKIAVCVKHVPCGTLRMRPDSGTLDRTGPGELNATDKNAIEEALRLKEGGDAEVVLVTMGPAAATESLRTGLGMGADRAVLVDDDGASPAPTSSRRAACSPACSSASRPTSCCSASRPPTAAAPCSGPRSPSGCSCRSCRRPTKLTLGDGIASGVDRETEVGNDLIEAKLPAVVAVSDAINEPRYTSLKGMMGAKKKPLDTLTASDLGLAADAVGDRRLADRRARHRRAAGPGRRGHDRGRRHRRPGRSSTTWTETRPRMSGSMLVFLEHHEQRAVARVARRARPRRPRSIADVAAVLVGDDDLDAARRARPAGYGAATVFTAADAFAVAAARSPHRRAGRARARRRGFDTVLFSNSVLAADVAAGLAARLDAGINWDLVDLELRDGEPVGKQPMLQDSVLAEVGWRSPQRDRAVPPGSFEAVAVRRRARAPRSSR